MSASLTRRGRPQILLASRDRSPVHCPHPQRECNLMNIHDLTMTGISGEDISFADFRDEAMLIVNLASQ